MRRIAIIINDNLANWQGGLNYIFGLATSAREFCPDDYEFIFLTEKNPKPEISDQLKGFQFSRLNRNSPKLYYRILRRIAKIIFGYDRFIDVQLQKLKVDLLTHSGDLGRGAKTPAITWFPDFQHKALPHLFSDKERVQRDRKIQMYLENSDRLILSSESAFNDLKQYYPNSISYWHKVRVLPFPASLPSDFFPVDLRDHYGLSEKYFFVPNQFWRHKNHLLVIEAISQAIKISNDIQVVFTGKTDDWRHADYYNDLLAEISRLAVSPNVKILGLVPRSHVYSLMQYSVAVINPSLFEGWSTTVEEAKLMKKVLLLSDIPVHREQNPALGRFFMPQDAAELAKLMVDNIQNGINLDVKGDQVEQSGAEARRDFATKYISIVNEIIK